MGSLIYMLRKARRIPDMYEIVCHGFIWAIFLNINITQGQQSDMQWNNMRQEVRDFCSKVYLGVLQTKTQTRGLDTDSIFYFNLN